MKRLAEYTAIVLATLAILFIVWELRLVVLVFALSLLMAAFVRPLVQLLTQRRLPLAGAVLLIYLSGLVLLVLAFLVLSGPAGRELELLVNVLTYRYEQIHPFWTEGSAFQQQVARLLPPAEDVYELLAAREGQFLAEALLGLGNITLTLLGGLVSVLVLSVYWTVDREHFERLWLSLLEPERRARAREIWRTMETGVGSYLRSEMIQAVFAIVLLGVGYTLLEVKYSILLALLSALLWLVPLVGFMLTIIPAFLAGYATNLLVGVVAVLFTAAVLLALELFIEPRFFDQRRHYSPLLTLLLILPLAEAYGLLGFLAAPPLAVTIQSLLTSLSRPRREQIQSIYPSAQVVDLRVQLEEMQTQTLNLDKAPPPEVNNLMQRLASLLTEAETTFDQRQSSPVPQENQSAHQPQS